MAKITKVVGKLNEVNPMGLAGKIIEGAFDVNNIEEALKARAILKEALRSFSELIDTANAKLDDVVTVNNIKGLDCDKAVIEVNGNKYIYEVDETVSINLGAKYATNEELLKDHPTLGAMKETVIYSLDRTAIKKLDQATQDKLVADGVVTVVKTELVKETFKSNK
jgi:hypothetical protein